ncbi:MAG TPA: PH domain-containing protein [Miltoncostaeaceae bacterium]|nr:PH domain-containing protein [Miltoncostaeaceae bacterium]
MFGWRAVRVVGVIGLISLVTGRSPLAVGLAVLVAAALTAPFAVLAWRRFTYRVADGRLEVRSGIFTRALRTIPLDRVRGVDVSAPLLHRLAGLVQVRVDDAAGGASASGLRLAAVSRGDAEALREAVLSRRPVAPEAAAAEAEGRVLARVPLGTLAVAGATSGRYLLVPMAALAAALNAIRDANVGWVDDLAGRGVDLVPTHPAGVAVLIVAAIALATGAAALGSLIVDGGFRLTGRPGRLVAERGLVAHRSVTIDRSRVRALEVRDSPPWRALDLAALRAVVGGVPSGEGDARGRTTLLPAGPADEVWRLAREIDPGSHWGLDPHPRAALSRRLVRAAGAPAVAAVVAAVLAPWQLAVALAAVAVLMVPVGLDRYRSLGNRLERGRLGLREGSLSRRHSLVVPEGVVAYRVSQSPFQRRAGLCTLTAFLGQGAGSRRALDVAPARAAGLLERLEPELVQPLLAGGTRPGEQ